MATAGLTGGALGTGVAAGAEVISKAPEPEALVVTRWFDSGEGSEPYSATLRVTGRRVGVDRPRAGDTFVHDERIQEILPGTGAVSVTSWIYGLRPGEWTIDAEVVAAASRAGMGASAKLPKRTVPAEPVAWSWARWAISTAAPRPFKTRSALFAPLAPVPAVMPGLYTILAIVGGLVALIIQGSILTAEGIPAIPALAVSLLATALGLLGAKLWYAVLHPDESILKPGWAVDGFLVVAPIAGTVGLMVANVPIGRVLDATAPGLFLAVAIGRVGCFLSGCCAGRLTASRWGVWSSDHRVGARRIPAQLIESLAGLVLGVAALPLVASHLLPVHGLVFVGGFALYGAARQVLLRLRAERRSWGLSLQLTAGASTGVAALIAVLSAIQIAGRPAFA